MTDAAEPTPRRGMTFPFFLSLLLFAGVLADLYLMPPGFVASAAYRQNGYILVGVIVVALLLWFWVLVAARRRTSRFEGPVQTSRGTNGALQPILATIFLVVAANLAWSQTIPRWLNYFASERTTSERFVVAGGVVTKSRCSEVAVRSDGFGETELCVPLEIAGGLGAEEGALIEVSGPSSWFGLEPEWYERVNEALLQPELVVGRPSPVDAEAVAEPTAAEPRIDAAPVIGPAVVGPAAGKDKMPPRVERRP